MYLQDFQSNQVYSYTSQEIMLLLTTTTVQLLKLHKLNDNEITTVQKNA